MTTQRRLAVGRERLSRDKTPTGQIDPPVPPILVRGTPAGDAGLAGKIEAREVDDAAERLRRHAPLDKAEARKRILQRLKAQGLYFDEDGITRVRGEAA